MTAGTGTAGFENLQLLEDGMSVVDDGSQHSYGYDDDFKSHGGTSLKSGEQAAYHVDNR